MRRARHARTQRAGGGTLCGRSARPSASAAWEGVCRVHGRHAACSSRPIATRRRRHTVLPLGAGLRQRGWGGVTAERGRHETCSSRAGATRRRRHTVLRRASAERADGTRRARLARSRRAGGGTLCGRFARPSASESPHSMPALLSMSPLVDFSLSAFFMQPGLMIVYYGTTEGSFTLQL